MNFIVFIVFKTDFAVDSRSLIQVSLHLVYQALLATMLCIGFLIILLAWVIILERHYIASSHGEHALLVKAQNLICETAFLWLLLSDIITSLLSQDQSFF